ncbi:peptidoglycan-binding protein, partial [Paracoccaceae bacterium]|nr:peptidoglycan-binding protein [Paracoccaceae bacterium]
IAKFKNISHSDGPCTFTPFINLTITINVKDESYVGRMKSDCGDLDKFIRGRIDRNGTLYYNSREKLCVKRTKGRVYQDCLEEIAFSTLFNGKLYGSLIIENKVNNLNVFSKKFKLKKISGPSNTATQTTQSTSPPDPLSTVFKGLPSKTRKDIQTALKEKGFYTSTIDGLYGKGTRKAIVGFFKEKGLGDDLEKLDLRKELSIIANIQFTEKKIEEVPKPVVEKIVVVEKEQGKPMKEDEARLLLSQLVQYSQDNPGTFDLDFAVEFNKVRDITKGLWSDQLSKNFEKFRGYLAKFPDFITYVEAEKKIAEEKLKMKVASLRTVLKKNVTILEEWARKKCP